MQVLLTRDKKKKIKTHITVVMSHFVITATPCNTRRTLQ